MTCELTMIGRWTLIYYEQFQEKISYQLCRNLLLLLWSLLAFFSCSTGSSTSPFRGTRLDWMSEFSKPTTSFSTMGPIQSSISLWPLQTSATFEKVKNEILKKKISTKRNKVFSFDEYYLPAQQKHPKVQCLYWNRQFLRLLCIRIVHGWVEK